MKNKNLAIGTLLGMALCSLFNTNMRYINGWVESIVLRRKAGDFLCNEDRQMKKTGLYIIMDKFFEDMSDPYLNTLIFPQLGTFDIRMAAIIFLIITTVLSFYFPALYKLGYEKTK